MAEQTHIIETDIISEQEFELLYNSDLGVCMTSSYNSFLITSGEEYQIQWGDQTFTCTAFDGTYAGEYPCVALGNPIGVGGLDNGLPFIIGVIFASATTNLCVICALTEMTSVNLRVYQKVPVVVEIDNLSERTLTFYLNESVGFYWANFEEPDHSKLLALGEVYHVFWAGTEYVVTAQATIVDGIEAVFVGNQLFAGGANDDIPFVFATYINPYDTTQAAWLVYSFTEEPKTVRVYQVLESLNGTDIVPTKMYTLFEDVDSIYGASVPLSDLSGEIVVGEEYMVLWDANGYRVTAKELRDENDGEASYVSYLGNGSYIGGESSDAPFGIIFMYSSSDTLSMVLIVAYDNSTSKTVRVYQPSASSDVSDSANIVLKDLNGEDVVYEGVSEIALIDDAGNDVMFSRGELLEGLQIDLNMSRGNQTVEAPKGYLVKKATIKKPATMRPENIAEGVNIAGVVGSLKASTPKETTIEPDFSEGDMVVAPEDGTMFSKVTIPTPDTLVPENIADGINIAGIVGTLAAGGGNNVKVAYGIGYGSSTYKITANHNLGVIPDLFIAYLSDTGHIYLSLDAVTKDTFIFMSSVLKDKFGLSNGLITIGPTSVGGYAYCSAYAGTIETGHTYDVMPSAATTTTLTFGTSSNKVVRGVCYAWIAIGGLFS